MAKKLEESLPAEGQTRRLGFMAGQIRTPEDFNHMGIEEVDRLFGSGE